MIRAFRVKNFRGISDSGFLEIKPITILVGRNSSGKSSILRVLPLLKQSVAQDTRDPILWFGRSVDFGSFDETVSKFGDQKEISFEFRLDISGGAADRDVLVSTTGEYLYFAPPGSGRNIFTSKTAEVEIGLTVRRRTSSEGAYVSALSVTHGADRLRILTTEAGDLERIQFNERVFNTGPKVRLGAGKGRFFPELIRVIPEGTTAEEARRLPMAFYRESPFLDVLLAHVQPLVHGNTKTQTLRQIALKLSFGSSSEFKQQITRQPERFHRASGPLGEDTEQLIESLRGAVLLRYLPEIFQEAANQVSRLGKGVRYLEPVRARAARYYRFQELAIDEIDPQGENVPMFLNSLSYAEQQSLEAWMTEALGFQVHATRAGGHTKLIVKESGSEMELNLADTGFGYSQILPIVLQLWKTRQDSPRRRPPEAKQTIIAVEQPELHLHPQFQALLGDVFCLALAAARTSELPLALVVETHSEHLVNRLGALIEKGTIKTSDVGVYVFQREAPNTPTQVLQTTFSSTGVLNDPWPFGFFTPDVK